MRVGINGFGRMGRLALRVGLARPEWSFVAVNEIAGDPEQLALLLEFDSAKGRLPTPCRAAEGALHVGDSRLRLTREASPSEIPWADLGVDLVLECTGRFRRADLLKPHLAGGAMRVVVSCPVPDVPNIVLGVNDSDDAIRGEPIVTAASCTTNALAPLVRVLHDAVGIERGLVTTIHAPTNSQVVLDRPHTDARRARSAAANLIPTTTNSAHAVGLIVPELAGKLDSIAIRTPVQNASLVDAVFHVSRDTTVSAIRETFCAAAEGPALAGILGVEDRPLVSSDFALDPRSVIVDTNMIRVTDHRLVKLVAWYDNEWGYANRLMELAARLAGSLSSS